MPKKPILPEPKPNGIKGYVSMKDKSIQSTVDLHTTMLICCIVLIVLSLVLGIINIFLIKNLSISNLTTLDEWVECTLENNIGYKVKKDWTTMGYSDSVIFQPTETTAVAVSTKRVEDINRGNEDFKLTHDTLRTYIENDLKAINAEEGYSVENVTCEEYVTLGTTGYRYTFTQKTPTENQTVSTYTNSVFFIYEGYLYSFSYTSSVMGYAIPEFEYLLSSIRLIPESERPNLLPSEEFNSSLASDYGDLGNSLTSKPEESSDTDTSSTTSE